LLCLVGAGSYCAIAGDGDFYRYVKIENFVTAIEGGDEPVLGATLDAVGVEIDGVTYYATRVLAQKGLTYSSGPADVLGPPDSDCEFRSYLNLGPVSAGGYVVLGFDLPAQHFSSHARILVFELGPTLCPAQHNWRDDPVIISISKDLDPRSFELLGTTEPGQNIVIVP